MVHHESFPASRLIGLMIRQISSPVALRIKEYAKRHPFFKKYICIGTANLYNFGEMRVKMWILRLGRPVALPVLSEQEAVNLGGNILGEIVVFTILSSVLVAELTRQSIRDEEKKAKQQREWDDKVAELEQLRSDVAERGGRIDGLSQLLRQYLNSINSSASSGNGEKETRESQTEHNSLAD